MPASSSPRSSSLGVMAGISAAAEPTGKPNIVFILADDLGRARLRLHGRDRDQDAAPRQARRGRARSSTRSTSSRSARPTRAALMTGRYPMRHGLQVGVVRPWAQYGLPLEERTLPQALKDAGYATAISASGTSATSRPSTCRPGAASTTSTATTTARSTTSPTSATAASTGTATTRSAATRATHAPDRRGGGEVRRRHRRQEAVLPLRAVQRRPRAAPGAGEVHGAVRQADGRTARSTPACSPRWTRRSGRSSRPSRRPAFAANTLFVFTSDNGGPHPGA